MISKLTNFDCYSSAQVLQLRLRDWMWPSAMAMAIGIALLGQSDAVTYRIGSITYYANAYGPPLFLALLVFAGIRWCWIGSPRAFDPEQRARRRLPIARVLLDLPGLLVAGYAIWIVTMVVLGLVGVVDLD